ncbi:MAG TPA: TIGR03435 family protein, partial [Bryobacteraceae bacterium]|nr:TIGR03435 family protein [Bryobacteraceae bacterium]
RSASLVDLIANAYGVDANRVLEGPNWLDMERFDLIARVAAGTTPQTARLMLQSLLADRFGLAVHNEQRPMQAWILTKGTGEPKMTLSETSGGSCRREPQTDERSPIPAICTGVTMQAFARQLQQMAGDYLLSPVLDQTSLEDSWDLRLKWTPKNRLIAAAGDAVTIFSAIEKQLGLKLQSSSVPALAIIVDRVNRTPSTNGPEAEAQLPRPPQPSFEVATIKPTDPQFHGVRIQTPPNGMVSIRGITLGYLVQTIWFVTPEMIAGAPQWFDTQRWDITAKVSSAPGAAPPTDLDSMLTMVRTLLEDRFKLRTHREERTVPAYALTAEKPRLHAADPSNRTGCNEGPGPDGKDPRIVNPALERLVTCTNITMAEFAAQLPRIANRRNPLNGPIRSTVLDSTGIQGAWDFTLSFSPDSAPAATSGDDASTPNGKISLAEALNSQLGLKLQLVKRPASVLVIDHVESAPAGN